LIEVYLEDDFPKEFIGLMFEENIGITIFFKDSSISPLSAILIDRLLKTHMNVCNGESSFIRCIVSSLCFIHEIIHNYGVKSEEKVDKMITCLIKILSIDYRKEYLSF